MKTQVTFRHFNGQHPKLHQAAEELAASFTKYNNHIISTNVEFINNTDKIVNFTVHLKEHTIAAEFASDDFHKSLNAAADKIVKQIHKYKDKKNNTKTNTKLKNIVNVFEESIKDEFDESFENEFDDE